ncbi:hypothetical protein BLA50215_07792 [Burkholderia lata]|nr:hypothetical protein BLA50215_07792 [Burkholderia lata]
MSSPSPRFARSHWFNPSGVHALAWLNPNALNVSVMTAVSKTVFHDGDHPDV